MSSVEIIEGIKIIKGKFAGEFGFISSYLIIDNDEALIIDPGTAGHPGEMIVETIKQHGLKPKSDTVGIVCTHGHPDHTGGNANIKNAGNAQIFIHSDDVIFVQDHDRSYDLYIAPVSEVILGKDHLEEDKAIFLGMAGPDVTVERQLKNSRQWG